jgi:hypothetical protein
MRKIILGLAAMSVALPAMASAQPGYYGGGGYGRYDRGYDGYNRREHRRDERRYDRGYNGYYGNGYSNNYNGYYANNYGGRYGNYYNSYGYYSGPSWRGNDGRYYCRRSDGSAGTLIGGAAGAVIGSQVAGRGDHALGAILGGAIGAIIGNSADRGNGYRCR